MNAYEEILSIMRNEGRKDNPPQIQIGIMRDTATCMIGRLELSGSDLMATEHLKGNLKKGDKVAIYRYSDERYIILEKVVPL